MNRWSRRRWFEVFLGGLAAVDLIYLLSPWVSAPFTELVQSLPQYWLYGLGFAFALFLTAVLVTDRTTLPARLGLRHFVAYPPGWVGFVVATPLLVGLCIMDDGFARAFHLEPYDAYSGAHPFQTYELVFWPSAGCIFLCLAAALAAVLVAASLASGLLASLIEPSPVETPPDSYASLATFDELMDWVGDDAPLTDPAKNRFGHHAEIARRISDRILNGQGTGKKFDTALIGALGAGKTTILNLVRARLRRETGRTIDVASISVWSFDSPQAAVRAIIDVVVGVFAQRVRTVGLAGISSRYLNIVGQQSGIAGTVLRVLEPEKDPKRLLERFDRIAGALNLQVVVWIEDLERFAGFDALAGDDASDNTGQDQIRLIRAIVATLEKLSRFHVVIASTRLGTRVDIKKLALFVEQVPRLSNESVWDFTAVFRRALYEESGIYDPADASYRDRLAALDKEERRESLRFTKRRAREDPALAIATLLDNPRTLKYALRTTNDAWKTLIGEINFDELFMMNVIRAAEPSFIDFINENEFIDVLREGWSDLTKEALGEKMNETAKEFAKALEERLALLPKKRATAIRTLIHTVFEQDQTRVEQAQAKNPLWLGAATYANNWERFLGPPVYVDRTAQTVMHAIAEWQKGERERLVQLILDEDKLVEAFRFRLSVDDLVSLLIEVVRASIELGPEDWAQEDPPAVISVWRMLLRSGETPARLGTVVAELAREVVPRNLQLAHTLGHFFATRESQVRSLLSPDAMSTVHAAIHDEMRKHLGEPDALARALRSAQPYTVYWSAWTLDRIRADDLELPPFEGFSVIAKALVQLGQTDPTTALSQITPFVIDRKRTYSGFSHVLRAVELQELFGKDAVFELVRATAVDDSFPESIRQQYAALHGFVLGIEDQTDS